MKIALVVIGVVLFWIVVLGSAILSANRATGVRLVPDIPYAEGTPEALRLDLQNNSTHKLRMGTNNHGALDAICDDCTQSADVVCERTIHEITCKDGK